MSTTPTNIENRGPLLITRAARRSPRRNTGRRRAPGALVVDGVLLNLRPLASAVSLHLSRRPARRPLLERFGGRRSSFLRAAAAVPVAASASSFFSSTARVRRAAGVVVYVFSSIFSCAFVLRGCCRRCFPSLGSFIAGMQLTECQCSQPRTAAVPSCQGFVAAPLRCR